MSDEERAWAAMARIFNRYPETPKACRDWCVTVLQQEAKAVRAEEREACARMADEWGCSEDENENRSIPAAEFEKKYGEYDRLADTIRARGEE